MSESAFVTAVHEETKLVSSIPRHYLELFPVYREVSEDEIIDLRRKEEKRVFGEYITPAPKAKASASTKEGDK